MRLPWLYEAVPLIWALGTIVLLASRGRNAERNRDMVQLHTSAPLVIGMGMLGFFVIAGVIPFVGIVVKMK